MFIKFCETVSQSFGEKTTGWGRMMRKAVSTWYLKKDPKSLVMHITKYPQRENWSHRDVLRLAHPQVAQKGEDALVYDQIFHYATHGKEEGLMGCQGELYPSFLVPNFKGRPFKACLQVMKSAIKADTFV